MTRSQIRAFVDSSSVERIREVLDLLQKLLDLRDHEAFFRNLADAKLQK
jgi:hypothetical protein